jgi:hypothetical protein
MVSRKMEAQFDVDRRNDEDYADIYPEDFSVVRLR